MTNDTLNAVAMKVLINQFDWSKTPLGDRSSWPPLLRSMVNLCLDLKLPAIICWGESLTQIYNDLYAEQIGKKHPHALGITPDQTWPETWEDFKRNQLPGLLNGKPSKMENARFILNRQGYPEEGYFTTAYTPILDDHEKFQGIFAVSTETTSSVINENLLRSLRNKQLENLFVQAPIAMCILKGPQMIVEVANEKMLELWGKTPGQVMNKPVFEGVPDAGNQGFENLVNTVYHTGVRVVYDEIAITLFRNGKNENIFVKLVYEPLRESDGTVTGIMTMADEVTERVNFRKKIEESEERLRMAIQATNLGTWDYFPLTGELHWSDECKRIYAIPSHEKIDMQLFADLTYPADKEWVDGEINKAIDPEIGGSYDITFRILRFTDRSIRWIRSRGKVYFNKEKQPERFLGTVVDVTKEKQFQETLLENELRLRLAVEAAQMGTFDWDMINSSFQYSEKLAQMLGFAGASGLKQKELADRIHPDDQPMRMKAHQTAFEKGTLFYEARMLLPDNSIRWLRVSGKVIFDENNQPARMYGTILDITDQKTQTEKLEREVTERTAKLKEKNIALQGSEERYHKMIDEVQDYAIILLDSDGIIQNWNKGAEKIKLYKEKEIVGKHFSIFYLPEDQAKELPRQLITEAANNGRASHEGWRVKKNGDMFWGSITITALHDKQDQIIGFSKVTRDLTDKKNAENKLLLYTQELESKNSELEQFAYIASHDLQEPLRKIMTFSEMMQQNLSDEKMRLKYSDKINHSAKRMSDLIRSVLNYSRLGAETQDMEPVDLNGIISGVIQDFELVIEEKKAIISCDALPVITGNPLQLSQLFANLMSNSLKFTDKIPFIMIQSRMVNLEEMLDNPGLTADKKYLEVTFTDNGIGFAQEYDQKIFTIFQRLHGKLDYDGTGIGLALCKKILENHNGYITAVSQVGKGSSFIFYLPA